MKTDVSRNDSKTNEPTRSAAIAGVPSWLSFPAHERLMQADTAPAFVDRMQRTYHELILMEQVGTPGERARARSARAAYGHTLELLGALREARGQMLAK